MAKRTSTNAEKISVREAKRRLRTIAKYPWLYREYRKEISGKREALLESYSKNIRALFVPYPLANNDLSKINRRTGALQAAAAEPSYQIRGKALANYRVSFTFNVFPYQRRSAKADFFRMIWKNILEGNFIRPRDHRYLSWPIAKGLDSRGVRIYPRLAVAYDMFDHIRWIPTKKGKYINLGINFGSPSKLIFMSGRSVRIRARRGVLEVFKQELKSIRKVVRDTMVAVIKRQLVGKDAKGYVEPIKPIT